MTSIKRFSQTLRLKRRISNACKEARKNNQILCIGIAVRPEEDSLISISEQNKITTYLKSAWLSYIGEDVIHKIIRHQLKSMPPSSVEFCTWGYRDNGLLQKFKDYGHKAYRFEDGFVRTLSTHGIENQGYSIVKDYQDLYFCYDQPSDLEGMIAATDLTQNPAEHKVARKAIDLFKSKRITKFGIEAASSVQLPFNDEFVLVVGQVEHDQSIVRGSPHCKTNAQLAHIARMENPGKKIVYKPHPEVFKNPELVNTHMTAVKPHVDFVFGDPSIALTDILLKQPHIYTMTSGAGFEALIYGCKVTTIGGPYYAGWGVTDDRLSFPRRNVKRTVEDIFWCAYLQYTKFCDLEKRAIVPIFAN